MTSRGSYTLERKQENLQKAIAQFPRKVENDFMHTWAYVVKYVFQNFRMYCVPPLKPKIGLLLAHV